MFAIVSLAYLYTYLLRPTNVLIYLGLPMYLFTPAYLCAYLLRPTYVPIYSGLPMYLFTPAYLFTQAYLWIFLSVPIDFTQKWIIG